MTVLIAWLWQGLLVVAAIELLMWVRPRVNATTRHAIWWVALLGVVSIPLAHCASNVLLHLGSEPAAIAQSGTAATQGAVIDLPLLPDWVGALLLGLWGGTVLLGTARLWNGVAAIRRLESGSYPMPEARQARLACWRTWRTRGRRAELRLSNDHAGAAALGFGSPVILVGAALAEVLDDEELDAIVMHEYAHVARRDDWSRLLQAVIESVAGLHPAVAVIVRRINVEREAACDDWVVRHAMSTGRYAACLTELAALVTGGNRDGACAIVPGATGARGSLYTRVRRLLDADLDRSRRIRRAPVAVAAFGAGSVLLLAGSSVPVVTFARVTAEKPRIISTVTPASTTPARPVAEAAAVVSRTSRRTVAPARSSAPRAGREPAEPDPSARRVITSPGDGVAAEDAPHPERPTLVAYALAHAPHSAPTAIPAPIAGQSGKRLQESAWSRLAAGGAQVGASAARGGTAIGEGTKKAGLSVAGFFTRAGRGGAGSF